MKIKTYQSQFLAQLQNIYDVQESSTMFFILLEEIKNISRVDLALDQELVLTSDEEALFDSYLSRLLQHEPIQYITGRASLFGLDFEVNSKVLIPRTETEDLINWIIEDYKTNADEIKLLDIGTGSGCIAISLAKHLTQAKVTALDVSPDAIKVALANAVKNLVVIDFIEKDILKTEYLDEQYDVIVSNPPYVRNLEKQEIRDNVLEHEPHLALFVTDDNPLIFYDKIARLAFYNLKEGGRLYFEINQYLPKQMEQLLVSLGYKNVQLKKDIYGNYRMISGEK